MDSPDFGARKWEECCFRAVSIGGARPRGPPTAVSPADRPRGTRVSAVDDGFAVTSAPGGGRPYHGGRQWGARRPRHRRRWCRHRRQRLWRLVGEWTRQQTVAATLSAAFADEKHTSTRVAYFILPSRFVQRYIYIYIHAIYVYTHIVIKIRSYIKIKK